MNKYVLTWEMLSALSALLSFDLRLLIAEGFIFGEEKCFIKQHCFPNNPSQKLYLDVGQF